MRSTPRFVLVMRHAEKPDDSKISDLNAAGVARAQELATFIPAKFGALDFIIASAISKHSARPVETVKPLSVATGLPIDSSIADQDYAFLADELQTNDKYADKRILVCWHHGNIPLLMNALGAPQGSYRDPWDSRVFDLILQVVYATDPPAVVPVKEPF